MTKISKNKLNKKQPSKNRWLCLAIIFCIVICSIIILLPLLPNSSPWINYYGEIFGCIASGLIGGIIAYRIAKIQLDLQKDIDIQQRQEQYKTEMQIELTKEISRELWIIYREIANCYMSIAYLINICFSVNRLIFQKKVAKSSIDSYIISYNQHFDRVDTEYQKSKKILEDNGDLLTDSFACRARMLNWVIEDYQKFHQHYIDVLKSSSICYKKIKDIKEGIDRMNNNLKEIEDLLIECNSSFVEACNETSYYAEKIRDQIEEKFLGQIIPFENQDDTEKDSSETVLKPITLDMLKFGS